MSITVIQTYDVEIERMQEHDGWAISEFRLPITGETGSATTVFHSISVPAQPTQSICTRSATRSRFICRETASSARVTVGPWFQPDTAG